MAVGEFCFLLFLTCYEVADAYKHSGGGSEEIMSELAIREEAKDLRKYASAKGKL